MSLISEDISKQAITTYLRNDYLSTKDLTLLRKNLLINDSYFHEDYHTVSYSKNLFIPVTRLCRDFCTYCAFRISEEKLPNKHEPYITEDQVKQLLISAKELRCTEVLFTLGQSPEEKYEIALKWLEKEGFLSTIDYIKHLCELALEIGILPHSNPGVMTEREFSILKPYNASMGLMLETTNELLYTSPGGPHYYAPSKSPEERLKTIELAGILKHPFTTGLLLGIGETKQDITEALLTIKNLHEKYSHIQEIILQPFTPHENTLWSNFDPYDHDELINTILLASILVPDIPLQVPPNLRFNQTLFLQSGCRDFGGVSPITIDYVNPKNAWPKIEFLRKVVEKEKLIFRERLPIYPKYIKAKDNAWLSNKIRKTIDIHNLADNQGFRKS
ncbi:MAG: FO synthase subunit 1 [Candidatus Heimdallarchaeota archaeon LC_3]|nr:MAG: FO synthase subunit 1 [Candidatus Heimdallarchaeota archaeon LC_3]